METTELVAPGQPPCCTGSELTCVHSPSVLQMDILTNKPPDAETSESVQLSSAPLPSLAIGKSANSHSKIVPVGSVELGNACEHGSTASDISARKAGMVDLLPSSRRIDSCACHRTGKQAGGVFKPALAAQAQVNASTSPLATGAISSNDNSARLQGRGDLPLMRSFSLSAFPGTSTNVNLKLVRGRQRLPSLQFSRTPFAFQSFKGAQQRRHSTVPDQVLTPSNTPEINAAMSVTRMLAVSSLASESINAIPPHQQRPTEGSDNLVNDFVDDSPNQIFFFCIVLV